MRYRQKWQEADRRKKGVKPVKIAGCGTLSAYRRHLRRGEPVDHWCNLAHNADSRRRRAEARLRRAEAAIAENTALIRKFADSGLDASPIVEAARKAVKKARAVVPEATAAIAAAQADMDKAQADAAKAKGPSKAA